jgi:transposase
MLYLAIDQHSKQLTINLRDEAGDVIWRRQVSTKGNTVAEFLDEVGRRSSEGGYLAILEVCGFNDWLLDMLPQRGCRKVVLVQPDERSPHKTDRRDANALGELLWVNRQRLLAGRHVHGLRQVYIPTPQERQDRRLTALRRDLGAERTVLINRIKHLLACRNLTHQCPTRGIKTKAARRWLESLSLDELDRFELDHLLELWKGCDERLEALGGRLRARHQRQQASQILASIPGCAAYTALGLASRVGPVERFRTPRSLANYFGLTPGCRNSGNATHRLGSITKQGSPVARFLLGQVVIHVLRRDAWMRAWYKGIKQRRGSKIARVAVMRRLTTIIWHMLTKKEPYQMGGPPRRRLKIAKS